MLESFLSQSRMNNVDFLFKTMFFSYFPWNRKVKLKWFLGLCSKLRENLKFIDNVNYLGKIRGLLPYQPVYSKEMADKIEKIENEKIEKIARSNRTSFSFQPVDCFCSYKGLFTLYVDIFMGKIGYPCCD